MFQVPGQSPELGGTILDMATKHKQTVIQHLRLRHLTPLSTVCDGKHGVSFCAFVPTDADLTECVSSTFRQFLPSSVPQTKLSHALSQTCFSGFLLSSCGSEGMLPTWVNFVSSLFITAAAGHRLFWVKHSWTVNTDMCGEKETLSML